MGLPFWRCALVWRRVVEGERKAHSQTGSKSGPDSYVAPDHLSLGASGVVVKVIPKTYVPEEPNKRECGYINVMPIATRLTARSVSR